MKKLLFTCLLLISLSISMMGQKTYQKIEDVISNDSIKTELYSCLIESSKKSHARLLIGSYSCPVFHSKDEGYTFFITLVNNSLTIVEIDQD